jgi:hypothetical protein
VAGAITIVQELGAIGFNNYTLTGTGEPEQLSGSRISPALTRVLGISAIVGRTFTDDEEKPGAPAVAMIGEGLWKRRFGGDHELVGRTVLLDGAPTTVAGRGACVAESIFGSGHLYVADDRSREELRLNHLILVVGRLKNGVSMEQAQAEMNTVSTRMGQQYPEWWRSGSEQDCWAGWRSGARFRAWCWGCRCGTLRYSLEWRLRWGLWRSQLARFLHYERREWSDCGAPLRIRMSPTLPRPLRLRRAALAAWRL